MLRPRPPHTYLVGPCLSLLPETVHNTVAFILPLLDEDVSTLSLILFHLIRALRSGSMYCFLLCCRLSSALYVALFSRPSPCYSCFGQVQKDIFSSFPCSVLDAFTLNVANIPNSCLFTELCFIRPIRVTLFGLSSLVPALHSVRPKLPTAQIQIPLSETL